MLDQLKDVEKGPLSIFALQGLRAKALTISPPTPSYGQLIHNLDRGALHDSRGPPVLTGCRYPGA